MSRRISIPLLITVVVMTIVANAIPPPPHGGYPGEWGLNPNNWSTATGSYASQFALRDPLAIGADQYWIIGWGPPLTYLDNGPPITMQLWIEMNMVCTYHYTSYQWHRLGDAAETITFTIDGTVSSNEDQYVLLTSEPGWDPSYLHFQENIGVGDDNNARQQIPISWRGRWGEGLVIGENIVEDWSPLMWFCGIMILDRFPPCDHWFQFEGSFDLLYHEADGYYKLVLGGCPTPEL